jgi:hypothetical protein
VCHAREDGHKSRRNEKQRRIRETKTDPNYAKIDAWRKQTTACQEATEVYPEEMEANPEEIKSVVEHQDGPKEEAEVDTINSLEDRYEDRRLVVEPRG